MVAALVAVVAIGGWGSRRRSRPAPWQSSPPIRSSVRLILLALIGVRTEVDGASYSSSHALDISMAPSGALELDWDGKQVGVGQVIGDVLAVACLIKGDRDPDHEDKSGRFALRQVVAPYR